jgi:UDP-N-acetylmuramoylalanine-D-glutamate ligase
MAIEALVQIPQVLREDQPEDLKDAALPVAANGISAFPETVSSAENTGSEPWTGVQRALRMSAMHVLLQILFARNRSAARFR